MRSRRFRSSPPGALPTGAGWSPRWRSARKEFCLAPASWQRWSPLHANFKQAIVDSDGHDTQLSEIPDIAAGLVWPGAMTRSRRNRFVERWAGREWALRQGRAEAIARLRAARESGDVDEGPLSMGQDAGLVHDIPRAADIVARIAQEAEEILARKLPRLLAPTG